MVQHVAVNVPILRKAGELGVEILLPKGYQRVARHYGRPIGGATVGALKFGIHIIVKVGRESVRIIDDMIDLDTPQVLVKGRIQDNRSKWSACC